MNFTEEVTDSGRRKPEELEGRVALVTGAARGLGLGMAEELARRGAHVVIADLESARAKAEATRLQARKLRVESAALDIADAASVEACMANLVGQHERLDILVNNAAVGQRVTPLVSLPDEEWNRVLGTTLTGTFYCCRAAARIMERQGQGAMVNVASVNGQNPVPLVVAYNVAKAGVISLTRTLALELAAYGVRVNAVCPGPVYTDFNRAVMAQRARGLGISQEEMIERVRAAVPLGRWGEPQDIAGVVAFLCGPDSSWMTGEVIRVSGGLEGVSAAPPRRATTD